jgi:UDP-N-acetyl-D-galactosamine dehydrogenase
VVDIYHTLSEYTSNITVYDPWASVAHVRHEYGIEVVNQLPQEQYDAVILAVAHNDFKTVDVPSLLNECGVVYDVKGVLDREIVDGRL